MRLKTRITASAETVAALSAKKVYEVTPLKDGAFVYLRKKLPTAEIYAIPEGIPDGELSLEVTEVGGLDSAKKTGTAQIVCGLHGERLTAFFVPRRHTERESTAYFSASHGCVTIWAEKGKVAIRMHIIGIDAAIRIMRVVLWEGEPAKLPKAMMRFKDAVAAAVRKASCSECMHMHYGKERAMRPNGNGKPAVAPGKTDFGKKVAAAVKPVPTSTKK